MAKNVIDGTVDAVPDRNLKDDTGEEKIIVATFGDDPEEAFKRNKQLAENSVFELNDPMNPKEMKTVTTDVNSIAWPSEDFPPIEIDLPAFGGQPKTVRTTTSTTTNPETEDLWKRRYFDLLKAYTKLAESIK